MKTQKNTKKEAFYEVVGWLGAAIVLLGYALLSLDVIKGDAIFYHFLMLCGSIGLAIITYHRRTYQPMVVNLVFCFFAAVALIRLMLA